MMAKVLPTDCYRQPATVHLPIVALICATPRPVWRSEKE